MKTIQFTDEELNTLKAALEYTYNSKLNTLATNRTIMSDEEDAALLKQAYKFINLTDKLK